MRKIFWLLLAVVSFFGEARISLAHDIPGKVMVLVFVKPQGNQLLVLTRVPMSAFTEIQFPMRGPGYLDFARADKAILDAANVYLTQSIEVFADGKQVADGQLLKTRVALPADKSFVDFDTALTNINSPPLTNNEDLYWNQASLDVLMTFPIVSGHAKFAIQANIERLAMETHTVLHYIQPNGEDTVFDYLGNPGVVQLEPGWWHAVNRFVVMGFFHILDGIDHLLFLFCLVIPARSVRALIPVITSFTIAHSISLIGSAYGLTPSALWFPPLIEALIALSIFYMACENILGAQLRTRWLVVFAFGLIHGFGFSFILADRMQFAGKHLASALFAFNLGVELGQLLVLIVTVPLLKIFFRYLARSRAAQATSITSEKIGAILFSAIAAHSAWHWLIERVDRLLQYSFSWPTFDAAFFAATMRWMILLVASAGTLWLLNELFKRFAKPQSEPTQIGK